MSAGDILGIFLLIVVIGFSLAFIYLVFLQRRAVVSQAKASSNVTTMTSQQEAVLELQKQSEQRQLRVLQIAEQQLTLQQEHNALLRELLTRLVERTEVTTSNAQEQLHPEAEQSPAL